ncbi:MAG TPA: zinc ABC transporter substrate-binding protein [Gaiellaceae bacterium]|nr:zinc ABC transporter substrate-binding protein [Gaiellaceae bacterium]
MKTRIVLSLGLLALAGCGAGTSPSRQTVVAAFYPIAFAAGQIAGPGVEVRNLTPPGVEPHDLELSGGEVRTIADADLVLYLRGFQPSLEAAIESTSAHGVDLLGPAVTDPHLWLDPSRYAALAARIAKELGRGQQAAPFRARLGALDEEFRDGLSRCERNEIVTSHAAFGYLGRYGLEQVAITGITPEAEPTPGDLAETVRRVRAAGATTVFFEKLVSPRLAETVAREVGAETAVLDPIEALTDEEIAAGEDYFSIMRKNLAALRKALECR